MSSGAHSRGQARPALGSQIIIQSAEEKQLKKLVRKEEKKMAKQVKGLEAAGIEDHETQLQLLGYDPEALRTQRSAYSYDSEVLRTQRHVISSSDSLQPNAPGAP